ncbi:MAG: hypothetical protein JWN67_2239 [Actinomycetia bacterium]|nr:hypothetical protein [Actinomycetes bacterium]
MAIPLPFVRRKPLPRHALPDAPRPAAKRRGDGATLGVVLILVLTSGFVAGTTASFTGTVTHKSSVFAVAALSSPTNAGGVMKNTSMEVTWSPVANTVENAGAGYLVNRKDLSAPNADGSSPGCVAGSFANVGSTAGSPYTDATASSFAQGRYVCYEIQTVYPCTGTPCNQGVNPWLSQGSNPIVALQTGYVVATVSSANVTTLNTFKQTDTITIKFNQAVDTSTVPTSGLAICSNASGNYLRVGTTNVTTSTTCDATQDPTVVFGILQTSFDITTSKRYNMSVAWSNCTAGPTGCQTATISVGSKISTAAGDIAISSTTFEFQPTGSATYVKSFAGALTLCAADPVGGLCRPDFTSAW